MQDKILDYKTIYKKFIIKDLFKIFFQINLITSEIAVETKALSKKYDHLLNQCINYNLYTKFKLKAKSKILFCDSSAENNASKHSTDWWNTSFFAVLGVIVIISLLFTAYDVTSKHVVQSKIIVAFSIVRNVKKLLTQRGSEDLKFLDSLKFFLNMAVIISHIYLKMVMSPVGNPIYFESSHFWILENGTIFISTFFVISAFLLTINFLNDMKSSDVNLGNFALAMFNRYFRLTVPYIFVILLHGLEVYPNSLGPNFKYFFEKEKWACRNFWYSKIMFTDNYNFRHEFVSIVF